MTFKKKLPTRKKKTSKLVLVRDIKSGHDILMPLSTIKNNPSRFKLITKEEQALKYHIRQFAHFKFNIPRGWWQKLKNEKIIK